MFRNAWPASPTSFQDKGDLFIRAFFAGDDLLGESQWPPYPRGERCGSQAVHVVDPFGTTGMEPSRFNPLAGLDPNDPDVADDAYMLADAMIVRSGGGGSSQFSEDESLSLL